MVTLTKTFSGLINPRDFGSPSEGKLNEVLVGGKEFC
jgi:hypothetical protein